MDEKHSVVFLYHVSIRSDLWLDARWFHILAFVSSAAVNLPVQMPSHTDLIAFGCLCTRELLDPRVVLFLVLGGTSILLSIIVVLVCIIRNHRCDLPFLHIFVSTIFFKNLFSNAYFNWGKMAFHCGFDLDFPDNGTSKGHLQQLMIPKVYW